jgi:hypothetical protein
MGDEKPAIEQSQTENKAWVQAQRSRRFSVNRGKTSAYKKKRSGEKAGEWKEAVESGEGWQVWS